MRHGQLVDDVQDAGENSELLGECFTLVIFPLSAALLTAGQLQAKVMLTLPVGRNRDRIKYSGTAFMLNSLDQENHSFQIKISLSGDCKHRSIWDPTDMN